MRLELNKIYDFSEESLISELQRVSKLTEKDLTKAEFKRHGKVSPDTIRRKFGNWQNALEKSGLSHRYSGRSISEKMKNQIAKNFDNNELIDELKRVAKKINSKSLSQQKFNENSEISASVISKRFGNWSLALKEADLEIVKMAKRYTLNEYFENILDVWTFKGRQPTYKEMNDFPSKITAGAYESRFSKWSTALSEFIKYLCSDSIEKDFNEVVIKSNEPSKKDIKKDKRDIPVSLRYKILSRDRFKCVKCGNSPSTDIKCKLQIDHIIPWSKGGKTELENLQTTCSECNNGKGNRFSE
ncbi:MAG: HNH endonuclease [Flavobacterium sp.]|nr:HNH endonuclease [Flavobacterium sp.]